jgi:hypothetical protein
MMGSPGNGRITTFTNRRLLRLAFGEDILPINSDLFGRIIRRNDYANQLTITQKVEVKSNTNININIMIEDADPASSFPRNVVYLALASNHPRKDGAIPVTATPLKSGSIRTKSTAKPRAAAINNTTLSRQNTSPPNTDSSFKSGLKGIPPSQQQERQA